MTYVPSRPARCTAEPDALPRAHTQLLAPSLWLARVRRLSGGGVAASRLPSMAARRADFLKRAPSELPMLAPTGARAAAELPSEHRAAPAPPPSPPVVFAAESDAAAPATGSPPGRGLRLYAVTWNLHGRRTPGAEVIDELLLPADQADIIVVGTQECEASISKSFFAPSKARWERALARALDASHVLVASQTLMAIHIAVFVAAPLVRHVTDVVTHYVAVGIGQVIGNKGAVAVAFRLRGRSIACLCAHLAAHQNAVQTRNSNYHAICTRLALLGPVAPDAATFVASFDWVVFLGDLNYRISGIRGVVETLCERADWAALGANDQLNEVRRLGEAFVGLSEGAIGFAPTYKLDVGTLRYDSSAKARIPAWTDRVLYAGARLLGYTSLPTVQYSDHVPVCALLQLD